MQNFAHFGEMKNAFWFLFFHINNTEFVRKKIFAFSKYFWQNHQNSSQKKKFTIPIIRNIPIIRQNDGLRVQILTFPGLNIAINNKPDIIKKVKGTK